ncbi:hypothetical protein JTE90_015989 [Oedothorax gibbosus]|uniref:Adenosine 5'-monophosphoramidase HINT3 n=1 Tax=Oedothorax gibbosus TaxID=931172 RepID=A0AAV6VTP5_9ARAC|nr:hypothetical protein JTE90_015989 [Oedothorax gibbosus]
METVVLEERGVEKLKKRYSPSIKIWHPLQFGASNARLCRLGDQPPPRKDFEFKMTTKDEKCLFCNIEDTSTEIIYKDDTYLAFKDIKPATAHHYLVIPKKHIKNTSSLHTSDVELVKKLVEIGENILKEKSANIEETMYGFHVPPFTSIQHLHLHVISPISEMGFISRLMFRPNSYWFITASSLVDKLEKK